MLAAIRFSPEGNPIDEKRAVIDRAYSQSRAH
jgi:hypothetical protein